jgi:hypothetical protein
MTPENLIRSRHEAESIGHHLFLKISLSALLYSKTKNVCGYLNGLILKTGDWHHFSAFKHSILLN